MFLWTDSSSFSHDLYIEELSEEIKMADDPSIVQIQPILSLNAKNSLSELCVFLASIMVFRNLEETMSAIFNNTLKSQKLHFRRRKPKHDSTVL